MCRGVWHIHIQGLSASLHLPIVPLIPMVNGVIRAALTGSQEPRWPIFSKSELSKKHGRNMYIWQHCKSGLLLSYFSGELAVKHLPAHHCFKWMEYFISCPLWYFVLWVLLSSPDQLLSILTPFTQNLLQFSPSTSVTSSLLNLSGAITFYKIFFF